MPFPLSFSQGSSVCPDFIQTFLLRSHSSLTAYVSEVCLNLGLQTLWQVCELGSQENCI